MITRLYIRMDIFSILVDYKKAYPEDESILLTNFLQLGKVNNCKNHKNVLPLQSKTLCVLRFELCVDMPDDINEKTYASVVQRIE